MAQAPCPPSIIITQAHNARAHTRRKKPNRVFMQNPYRPIIIKFATKVTTFFRPMVQSWGRILTSLQIVVTIKCMKITYHTPKHEKNQNVMNPKSDPFEWTEETFQKARPAPDVLPPAFFDGIRDARAHTKTRGPQKSPTKKQVTLRLDEDLLTMLRQTGHGWQTRLNKQLRTLFLDT